MERRRGRARRRRRSSRSRAHPGRDGEAHELEHLGAALGERLADGERRIVDPRLVEEHGLGEEALLDHPVDDLRTDVLGLRLHLGQLLVDLALALDLAPRGPRRASGTRVARRRCASRRIRASSVVPGRADEHAELVAPAGARRRRRPRRRRPPCARRRAPRCSRRAWRRARSRSSSSCSAASGPSTSTRSRTCWTKARNSSFFETGSVSQPTATIAPRAVVGRA